MRFTFHWPSAAKSLYLDLAKLLLKTVVGLRNNSALQSAFSVDTTGIASPGASQRPAGGQVLSEAIPVRVALQPLRSALEERFWESWGGSQEGSVMQLADGLNLDDTLGILDEIAIVLAFAFIGGFIASRLRLPPIVGYLAAGLAVGPFTPGFVADVALAEQLGEIGIVILMFGVGLHFSVRDLLAVRNIAIAGAIVQSVMTTLLSIGAAMLFGWGLGAGLVLGLALSVASTIVTRSQP